MAEILGAELLKVMGLMTPADAKKLIDSSVLDKKVSLTEIVQEAIIDNGRLEKSNNILTFPKNKKASKDSQESPLEKPSQEFDINEKITEKIKNKEINEEELLADEKFRPFSTSEFIISEKDKLKDSQSTLKKEEVKLLYKILSNYEFKALADDEKVKVKNGYLVYKKHY